MTKIIKLIINLVIISLCVSKSAYAVTTYTGGNFTMLDSNGQTFGGTNDVSWIFDETVINTSSNGTSFNGDIQSDTIFFGFPWILICVLTNFMFLCIQVSIIFMRRGLILIGLPCQGLNDNQRKNFSKRIEKKLIHFQTMMFL